MIQLNKYPSKFIGTFFLGIFISFLIISITHNHSYQLLDSDQNISQLNSDSIIDLHLGEGINCLVHSFANSIYSGKLKNEVLTENISDKTIYEIIEFSHFPSDLKFSNQFRGPPIKISL